MESYHLFSGDNFIIPPCIILKYKDYNKTKKKTQEIHIVNPELGKFSTSLSLSLSLARTESAGALEYIDGISVEW